MNEEYLKQLLLLTENLISKNLEGAKNAATALSALELTDDDRMSVGDIVRSNHIEFSYEELKSIVDCLNFDDTDVLLAEIELEKANMQNKVFTVDEVKQFKGYTLVKSGKVTDELDRYNLLHPLVLLTIGTRDNGLIQEMLQIMEG